MSENYCGAQRPSMHRNILLIRADVGQMKRTALSNVSNDKVFGYKRPHDAEGAGIIIRSWEQGAELSQYESGPDYVRMNKLAALKGLTKSQQQEPFRRMHPIKLKRGIDAVQAAPQLPSNIDPYHTYGSLPAFRSMETIRMMGDDSPSVRSLIQGDFVHDWCCHNQARAQQNAANLKSPTKALTSQSTIKAARGHAAAAQRRLGRNGKPAEPFKLKKFKSVQPRVHSFRDAQGR